MTTKKFVDVSTVQRMAKHAEMTGQAVSVTFVKRGDGSVRRMHARFSLRGVKGVGASYNARDKGLFNVFETPRCKATGRFLKVPRVTSAEARYRRSFPEDSVLRIKVGGEEVFA